MTSVIIQEIAMHIAQDCLCIFITHKPQYVHSKIHSYCDSFMRPTLHKCLYEFQDFLYKIASTLQCQSLHKLSWNYRDKAQGFCALYCSRLPCKTTQYQMIFIGMLSSPHIKYAITYMYVYKTMVYLTIWRFQFSHWLKWEAWPNIQICNSQASEARVCIYAAYRVT